MEFLLSVAGLVIAMWVLDRGDWETHRLQSVVGWVVVAGGAVWMVGSALGRWWG